MYSRRHSRVRKLAQAENGAPLQNGEKVVD